MKKLALFTFVFFGLITKTFSKHDTYYYYDQPISFTENNVSFAVYKNGAFDFYIDRVAGFNISFNSPQVSLSFNSGYNYNPYVQYDRYGAVIQVENIPIYYDYYGRVSQIGTVNINYHNGYVSRVGGLYIYYNGHRGYPHYSGYINRYNRSHVHAHHHYFSYPRYEYVVVSHKPYRRHYCPERYVYHKNHRKNHYYKKRSHRYYAENSKGNKLNYSRRATQDIPKNRNDYNRIARRSGNDQAKELFRGTSSVDESYYRSADKTNNSNKKNYRATRSKNSSERTVRRKPIDRNATDLFKKNRPERMLAAQNSSNNKTKRISEHQTRKSTTLKSVRTKPNYHSRSATNSKKVATRNARY